MLPELLTESRILVLTPEQKIKDPIAAAFSGHPVTVHWYLHWMRVGFVFETGEWFFHPVWTAKVDEIPDRWFHEKQLMRIL